MERPDSADYGTSRSCHKNGNRAATVEVSHKATLRMWASVRNSQLSGVQTPR